MPAPGASTIKLYRSVTAGVRPTVLAPGELFINEEDCVLCWPDTDGTIRTTWLSNAQGVPKVITASAYTVINTDEYLIFNNATGTTVTLPVPTPAMAGRALTIKNLSVLGPVVSSLSVVTSLVSTALGTAIVPATAGKWSKIICDGTKWVTMESN